MRVTQRDFSLCAVALAACLLAPCAGAQFGGSGANGAFRPSRNWTLDTTGRPNGWNFTDIHIPAGVVVTVIGSNPAILRAQNGVLVEGTLNANGGTQSVRQAGPGGFAGGDSTGTWGAGPGGGQPGYFNGYYSFYGQGASHATPSFDPFSSRTPPPTYGSVVPFDLRGGSGGGGYFNSRFGDGSPGGGGGGTIVLTTDGDLRIASSGAVKANGGAGQNRGAGSGGSVMLRAAGRVVVEGLLSAAGVGSVIDYSGDGFVRIDAATGMPQTSSGTVIGATSIATLPRFVADDPAVGSRWSLRLIPRPGDFAAIFLSPSPGPTPTAFGTLGIGGNMLLLGQGTAALPAVEPMLHVQLTVANLPSARGLSLYGQGIAWDAQGYVGLTPALAWTIQ